MDQRQIFISLFSYSVHTETFFFTIASFILAILLFYALRKNLSIVRTIEAIFYISFFSLILGRLWFFIFPWNGFMDLLKFFYLQQWIIASPGILIGASIGLVIFSIKRSIYLGKITDLLIIPTLISIPLFRIGCFIDGHILGKETAVPWCIDKLGKCTHPIALYYIFSAVIILFVIFFVFQERNHCFFRKRFYGEKTLWFLVLYFFSRFIISFFTVSNCFSYSDECSLIHLRYVSLCIFLIESIILLLTYYALQKVGIDTFKKSEGFNALVYLYKKWMPKKIEKK
jgi:prolipoprotein diacylglyceryltransferase